MFGNRFQAVVLILWIVCLLLLGLVSIMVDRDIQEQLNHERALKKD